MAITYVGSGAEVAATGGANLAVPVVAGIQADDFLWVPASASVATAFATNAMSGFTRRYAQNSNGGSPVGAGYYKQAAGSESGTITLASPGGLSVARMFAFRGVDWTTGPFDVADALPAGWSTSVSAYVIDDQVTTMTGVALLLHTWSNAASGTWTQPGSYTEVMDSTASGVVNATSAAYRIWSGSGSTGTRTVTRSAAVRGGAAGVALRPAVDTVTGTHAASLPVPATASAATVTAEGTAASVLPVPSATAAGSVTDTGASASVLPVPTSAAAGVVKATGTAASTLPVPTSLAVGGSALLGVGASTLPAPTSAAAGTVRLTGAGASVLPSLSSAAVASVRLAGAMASDLPVPTSTATGGTALLGSAASVLPMPTSLAIVPELRLTGSAASDLPLPTSETSALVFLDTSNWRDITISIGEPFSHSFTVGTPTGHPFTVGAPRSEP